MKSWTILAAAILCVAAVASEAACTFSNNATAKVMTLKANCTTTVPIVVPDGWTLDGKNKTITAVGTAFGAVVVNGGAVANVKNLVIKGTPASFPCSCHGSATRLRGLLLDGAAGDIDHVTVLDMNQDGDCGCQEGNGIEARNAPFDGTGSDPLDVSIRSCTVSGYQKNGITCAGNLECEIKTANINGGGQLLYIAQNGIQISYGAGGLVNQNVVNGNWYSGANWTSSGILVFESDGVSVENNAVNNNQSGIVAEAWHWLAPSVNANVLANNKVNESEWGIIVDALTVAGASTGNAHADHNQIRSNKIKNVGATGDTGIFVGTGDYDGGFLPVACGNVLKKNRITNFTTPTSVTENCPSCFELAPTRAAAAIAPATSPYLP